MRLRSTSSVLLIFLVLLLTGAYLLEGPDFYKGLLDRFDRSESELSFGEIVFQNGTEIKVEIADSSKERSQGLSNRDSLDQNHGLLFIYENKAKHQYWMKDMRFSLDFIWIDDNEIVDITENVTPEDPPKSDYFAKTPVNRVLEVNAGFVKEHNIKIGDRLDIHIPIE